MRQVRLKSLVRKLSILGVYLLFLSVQLNLKYNFPLSSVSTFSSAIGGNTSHHHNAGELNGSKTGKTTVQILKLNKRYEHRQIFQISVMSEDVATIFSPDRVLIPAPVQISHGTDLVTFFLRGPPRSTSII